MSELANYSDSIYRWLRGLQVPGVPGAFKLSNEGYFDLPNREQGLAFSCLALKVAYTVGVLDRFSPDELAQWEQYIKSFQTQEGRFKSYFEDRGLLNTVDGIGYRTIRIGGPFKFIKNMGVRRAETRQACAALRCFNTKSTLPLSFVPESVEECKKYFHSLDWKNPWGAGSQFGHILFFLEYNRMFEKQESNELVDAMWSELKTIQHLDTGSWYVGNPAKNNIINGIMKLFIAHEVCKKEIEYPEKIMDFVMEEEAIADGCNFLDALYVIYCCSKQTNYRRDEVKEYALKVKDDIKQYYRDDGAFSFYPHKSQTGYYGKKISRGLLESDVHGSHLFTWALTLAYEIENDFKPIGWKKPIT